MYNYAAVNMSRPLPLLSPPSVGATCPAVSSRPIHICYPTSSIGAPKSTQNRVKGKRPLLKIYGNMYEHFGDGSKPMIAMFGRENHPLTSYFIGYL